MTQLLCWAWDPSQNYSWLPQAGFRLPLPQRDEEHPQPHLLPKLSPPLKDCLGPRPPHSLGLGEKKWVQGGYSRWASQDHNAPPSGSRHRPSNPGKLCRNSAACPGPPSYPQHRSMSLALSPTRCGPFRSPEGRGLEGEVPVLLAVKTKHEPRVRCHN